ncbi:Ubiquitin-conjugating enzyme E2 1; AltName: Full=E2 ubiquitin-conjugating enzyme 1; AltName: Full=Ubiquitin carrier protein; AltName: Full=Ubiquitin-conjugating enzyme E2-24 kDa; AltName: Full=Ubiquitin-protein ligase [Serendipita indica DSM 11827]|uniref:Ubiquitin-conjugating enzyme E2 1 n=1 Tax=Serendipita indica (strain DSM 11827) TaxID=1109443 RepID=G4TXJ6_SERID|nr:Ubiquitin-conjugating enzyme E2 1; AltName: Full=E2 ubiquitin-conjugating enzyme 1; AltName: Full=Ubiquitin carrier protein; AltName: Full=Ubiquitin-conjugating enzyme E2-24 kDa; AltName: Full=Ubiquitin-protein ligase [Serendipita indica DSM 11827]CCA76039.1 probable UBC1-E2 ubiquitin-conjugating enzyme [Serendipita indica DSM 11827]
MDAKLRRLQKEIADLRADTASKITIELVDDSLLHLLGTFIGPPDTPYEGGTYEVDIVIPQTYPFSPPKMKFLTKLYHPNVSSASGAICLDILKDAWSPVLTLKSTMISLQSLLCSPEPTDPQDAEVAKHYMTSRESFNDTARYWAEIYAGAPPTEKKAGASNTEGEEKAATDGKKGKAPVKKAPVVDEIAAAGLNVAHVQQFEALGFERRKVIEVLKRLNYRGTNIAKITDDQVVEKLLS